jgi:phosphoribosylformylglycinamidine cyclo-ligase
LGLTQKVGRVKQTYAKTGVDIESANKLKNLIKPHALSTFRPEVLSGIGLFGGLFELKGYSEPVLVSSADGVGTKLMIASTLGKHETVGIDLVNHCVNDILTYGAEPLFFLDYIAMGKLIPQQVEGIVKGLATACKAVSCALIGGETAEMPGIYNSGDYELVGFIVGVVEKRAIIDGKLIQVGDTILGLPSSGLHTNGYSLVRQIFSVDRSALEVVYPELGRTLGEELLEPHRCYYSTLKPVLHLIKGIAHITGGGLLDNVPRVLPSGLAARFQAGSWTIPPIFSLIQQRGDIDKLEMCHVFNMGVGIAIICSPQDVDQFTRLIPEAQVIGKVGKQQGEERVTIS